MRKRVFTWVAAACLSITAVSAQNEGLEGFRPYQGESYSPTISYFLKAIKGTQSYYIVLDDNDRLVLRPESQLPRSFAEVKNALWRISEKSASTGEIALSFTNLFRTELFLSRSKATSGLQKPVDNANVPGGEIHWWVPSAGPTPSIAPGFFYVFDQIGGNAVVVIGADDNLRVVPRRYASYLDAEAAAKLPSSDVLLITPCLAEGYIPLTANDLNIRLTADIFNTEKKSGLFAGENDRFRLKPNRTFPPDVPFSSDASYRLQARGVHVVEDGFLASDASEKVPNAYADTISHWVALYSYFRTPEGLLDEGYVGVDTSYYRVGQDVAENAIRIASFGDVWYHNTSRKRLLDSYLFKFLYDPTLNQIKIISRAYITQPVAGTWSKDDILRNRNYARNSYLTAFFAGEGRYVPTLTSSEDGTFYVESGDMDNHYSKNIPSDLYTLRIEKSQDPSRIGKYLRINMAGEIEFIEKNDPRINHPSSQWAIESSSYTARIFNREVPVSPAADEYFGSSERTFGVSLDDSQPLFVMPGGDRDTIRYEAVSAELKSSSTLGYYAAGAGDNLASLRLTISHDADKKLAIGGENGILWVANNVGNEDVLSLGIEEMFNEPYGYEPNISGVAQLRRHYYRFFYPQDILGTRQYIGFSETSETHRYFLTTNPVGSPVFLLRELGTNSKNEPVYMFCEIDYPASSTLISAISVESSGALVRVELPASDVGCSTFSLGKSLPKLYLRITGADGKPIDVRQAGLYRPYTPEQEYFVAKPSSNSGSFNFLAFQAVKDYSRSVTFTLRYVRGVTMPQYLIINGYKDEGGGAFSGDFLTVLDVDSDNPAWGYASRHNILDSELLWQGRPRLGFIPAKVKADGLLYIDGDPQPRRVVYTTADRDKEGDYDYFLFSFRRFSEEGEQSEDFLIEGGRPEGQSAGAVNYYIQEHITLPVSVLGSYSTVSQDFESIFRIGDVLSTGQPTSPPGGLSVRDIPASSFTVLTGSGEILVRGAEGKQVTVSTLLGRRLESRRAASEERFGVSAGILVVTVEGEGTVKVLVK
ncbi:MAG: DUF6383 domain-containing protein [Tannerellaceae bacterium]|jgi:hypothetical protein|nr:DUF6383 domain-containing protein [Tannerellaceae bacterium]